MVTLSDGRVVLVLEADYFAGERRGEYIGEALVAFEKQPKILRAFVNVFAPLAAACTVNGEPLSIMEYRDMREVDINILTEANRKLNPHWYKWLDEAEEAVEALATRMDANAPLNTSRGSNKKKGQRRVK
jgi:hypothetical protein